MFLCELYLKITLRIAWHCSGVFVFAIIQGEEYLFSVEPVYGVEIASSKILLIPEFRIFWNPTRLCHVFALKMANQCNVPCHGKNLHVLKSKRY